MNTYKDYRRKRIQQWLMILAIIVLVGIAGKMEMLDLMAQP